MRIATWNINSVRARLHLLQQITKEAAPDIICLQETKVLDDLFPRKEIAEMGYGHIVTRGMKGYNGVAILSRIPLVDTETHYWCGRNDCRHICVRLADGLELHNFYIPAGGDQPDPKTNDKFAHKLQFLEEMATWFLENRSAEQPIILVGDLNIAPLENDVWSHKQLLKVVSHTPVEVKALIKVQSTLNWLDTSRHFVPSPENLYSWWSYRARDWSESNKGRRLDHIWTTQTLLPRLKRCKILRYARGWEKPSDHAPVLLELSD
jgi:exodeoxyribonuclease-3